LGAVESINELLRRKQFGRESSKNTLKRVAKLPAEQFLFTTIPFQKKTAITKEGKKVSVKHFLEEKTLIPKSVMNSAFKKINAQSRKKKGIAPPHGKKAMLVRFLSNELSTKYKQAKPMGTMVMEDITQSLQLGTRSTVTSGLGLTTSELSPVNTLLTSINTNLINEALNKEVFKVVDGLENQQNNALTIEEALNNWLNANYSTDDVPAVEEPEEELKTIKEQMIDSLNPETTFQHNTQQLLRVDGLLQAKFKESVGDSLDPIMAAPEFPQPMNESLLELSESLLLPGIEKIKPNTIGLLETNPRFLEAFMCGLNHEFASELLWRDILQIKGAVIFVSFGMRVITFHHHEK
jgi:hypothetical protein